MKKLNFPPKTLSFAELFHVVIHFNLHKIYIKEMFISRNYAWCKNLPDELNCYDNSSLPLHLDFHVVSHFIQESLIISTLLIVIWIEFSSRFSYALASISQKNDFIIKLKSLAKCLDSFHLNDNQVLFNMTYALLFMYSFITNH
jgi:mRNA-degrading endonuclease HigB of HigAB toxin-antitoxin module